MPCHHQADRKSNRSRGFTLVELLVVITIIAVLIALLLPALSRAKEMAIRVRCASNLRSFGQALFEYANDYEQYPGQRNISTGLPITRSDGETSFPNAMLGWECDTLMTYMTSSIGHDPTRPLPAAVTVLTCPDLRVPPPVLPSTIHSYPTMAFGTGDTIFTAGFLTAG